MRATTVKELPPCGRCGRRYRGRGDWNATMREGVIVGLLCPRCQSPEENAEAEINEATLDYRLDAFGRAVGFPKAPEGCAR